MEDPEPLPATRETQGSRRKSETAFRTISEVSQDLEVPQHVLRFWESKFTQIKPLKRGGGRRYYRPEDVHLLGHIRDLLYKDGYTIRGVQKLLRDPTAKPGKEDLRAGDQPVTEACAGPLDHHAELRSILTEVLELRRLLADARRK